MNPKKPFSVSTIYRLCQSQKTLLWFFAWKQAYPVPLLASVINEVTKTFKHLKEFGHLICSYFKSTDMSMRELSVLYMAITYTWSLPCFSLFLFPVKTEILIPGENSRIYSALFERLQHYKCFFSAFLCYWLIIDHWQFLSQSLFAWLLFSCPLSGDSAVHCKMSADGLYCSSKEVL